MHDVVSHQVSLIAVRAGALQVAAKDADAKEAARTIRSLSVTTLDELRTMVTLLRASGGESTELTPQPTLADLRKLVESSGTHTQLTGELPPTVGTPAQRALYRTVQEALTNVRKHAPGANACVELWQDGDGMGVTVTNTPPTPLPLPAWITAGLGRSARTGRDPARHPGRGPDRAGRLPGAAEGSPQRGLTCCSVGLRLTRLTREPRPATDPGAPGPCSAGSPARPAPRPDRVRCRVMGGHAGNYLCAVRRTGGAS